MSPVLRLRGECFFSLSDKNSTKFDIEKRVLAFAKTGKEMKIKACSFLLAGHVTE